MRKRFGRFVFIYMTVLWFFPTVALCETLYHEDFSSPGTLEDLGFTNVLNWTKDDPNEYSVVGGVAAQLHKIFTAVRGTSDPLIVEWRMNLQTGDPLIPEQFFHLATIQSGTGSNWRHYLIEVTSQEDANGPYLRFGVNELVMGLAETARLDSPMPGFTWVTMRVELNPSVSEGGDGSIRIWMDLGDGNGFVEFFSVADSPSAIAYDPQIQLSFMYNLISPLPILFDDLKVTTGEESIQTGTVTYQYDALGRLRNASFDDGTAVSDVGFDYDGTGNRMQKMVTQ